MQIIVFTISDNYYAISTDKVDEITKMVSCTNVPMSPDWVEGLINLRGNVVTLVNLSKLLHKGDDGCYNDIIVIQKEDIKIGLLISEVVEVLDIKDGDIQKIEDYESNDFIGVVREDDRIINIINIDTLITENEGSI